MKTPTKTHRQDAQEQGFVLVTLFTLMIPMLVVVVAFSTAMTSRSNELRTEFDQEMPDLLRFFRVLECGGLVEFQTI